MASCVFIEQLISGGRPAVSSPSALTYWPAVSVTAEFVDGAYSCPSGTHLLMTVQEVNAMPKSGVPDAALMRDNFFLGFTLVLSCYLLGKFVGAVLHVVRRG